MRDIDSIEEFEKKELNEQYNALRRAHCLSRLPAMSKRWLSQSVKFKNLLASRPPHRGMGGVGHELQQAVEATIVVLDPATSNEDKDRIIASLSMPERVWVNKALVDQSVFRHGMSVKLKQEYSPVTYAMAMALALDDKLFNSYRPDILTLAAVNAQQQWMGLWPKALGKRVQYALEKRLAKELAPVKKAAKFRTEMTGYIQKNWLDPIIVQDKYTDEDAVKFQTVCEAALKIGVPLDRSYFWLVRDRTTESNALPLDMIARKQMEKHDELRRKQNRGVLAWMRNRSCFTKKSGR